MDKAEYDKIYYRTHLNKIKNCHIDYYKKNSSKIDEWNRQWRKDNIDRVKASSRRSYIKNIEKVKERCRLWAQNNPEEHNERCKKWAREHPVKIRENWKKYYVNNSEKIKERARQYSKNHPHQRRKREHSKRKSDAGYRLKCSVSCSVYNRLRKRLGGKGGKSTWDFLPYTVDDLIKHLESLFEPWMNWQNYGRKDGCWSIDHIKPDSFFNYKSADDEEFQKCWALENLRPLRHLDNIKKGNKLII